MWTLGSKAVDRFRGDHRVITVRRIPGPRLEITQIIKGVIFVFTVLHSFGPLSCKFNLLFISNKQITADCFAFIYNSLIYLSCVESFQVKKKNHMLLSCSSVLCIFQQTILLYFFLLLLVI